MTGAARKAGPNGPVFDALFFGVKVPPDGQWHRVNGGFVRFWHEEDGWRGAWRSSQNLDTESAGPHERLSNACQVLMRSMLRTLRRYVAAVRQADDYTANGAPQVLAAVPSAVMGTNRERQSLTRRAIRGVP